MSKNIRISKNNITEEYVVEQEVEIQEEVYNVRAIAKPAPVQNLDQAYGMIPRAMSLMEAGDIGVAINAVLPLIKATCTLEKDGEVVENIGLESASVAIVALLAVLEANFTPSMVRSLQAFKESSLFKNLSQEDDEDKDKDKE